MRVLVACEESQAVCMAFRDLGHEAYSCDVQHCALYIHMEWHIVEDALAVIRTPCTFVTVDGAQHTVEAWDLLIAHPPCTYLTSAGAVRLFDHNHRIKDPDRYERGLAARRMFMAFLGANVPRIAVENPTPMKIWGLPSYSQIVEPWQFGEPWRKRTCLWLKGLPKLRPTQVVTPRGLWVNANSKHKDEYELRSHNNQKTRSKTFPGIARAMAEQWGQTDKEGQSWQPSP